eukprot:XP_017445407.1 PREDICTED: neutrophil immunoglobulin-like receptor 1 isoform X2 [Rattus norvegicus]
MGTALPPGPHPLPKPFRKALYLCSQAELQPLRGDAMTFTCKALLCLGMTLGLWITVLTEFLPRPILRVQPDTVVSTQSKVIFFCERSQGAELYCLYKKGNPRNPRCKEIRPKPGKKVEFSISKIDPYHAGHYHCYYQIHGQWSEDSDALELVVTGIYDYNELRLSVLPSPVVTVGRNMTLHCVSHSHYDKFILTKEDHKFTSSLDTQCIPPSGQCQALFVMGPMTSNHTGTFRCYGYYKHTPQLWSIPSEPLEIHISGLSKKPSLLTHQGHILDPGVNLTLQCCSDINYDRFALYKVGGADIMQHTSQCTDTGFSMTNFTLGYVNHSTGGQYRCYGAHDLSSEWSASSDPLDILITGQRHHAPSLSVMPNSTVHSGENVTLLCWSMYFVDTFILSKEGSGQPPLRLKSKFQDQQYQSEFSMSAVTSTHSGTYRCYGSLDSALYLLSFASAPVELIVSGHLQDISSTHSRKNILFLFCLQDALKPPAGQLKGSSQQPVSIRHHIIGNMRQTQAAYEIALVNHSSHFCHLNS